MQNVLNLSFSFYDWLLIFMVTALGTLSAYLKDPQLKAVKRLAIVMGTEGDGLPLETIAETDYVVRIPMSHHVDSLNVAAAAAVAFWELRASGSS